MSLLATLSVSAMACPNLTGSYTCTYRDHSSETVTISQSADKSGVITYVYNGSLIPTDNKVYDVPEDQSLKEGKFRAWCDDDVTLKTELVGKYWSNGAYYGDLLMDMNFSKDGDSLSSVTTGSVKNATETKPLDSTMTCTHNP